METKTNLRLEQELEDVMITEDEIEAYSGCTNRTQMCLTDCPWPFSGAYISHGE